MAKAKKNKPKKRRTGPIADSVDKHLLYEEAVQDVSFELDFFEKTFKKYRKRPARTLREDFCGTAAVAAAWTERHRNNEAWGVDLHAPTLAWGRQHHVSHLGTSAQRRVHLVEGNVLSAKTPSTDITAAFNFSYWIFKTRDQLAAYFRKVCEDLKEDGILFLDAFGGTEAMSHKKDRRKIPKSVRHDGMKLPKYTYVWDQELFNVVNHDIRCHIHFRFSDGSKLNRAFTYNWRLWTLPELKELLLHAGFRQVDVFLHGWDDDGESDEVYRRRTFYKNELAWVGYLAAMK